MVKRTNRFANYFAELDDVILSVLFFLLLLFFFDVDLVVSFSWAKDTTPVTSASPSIRLIIFFMW